MRYMTAKLDSELIRRLKIMAAQSGTTVTALLRQAVAQYLEKQK